MNFVSVLSIDNSESFFQTEGHDDEEVCDTSAEAIAYQLLRKFSLGSEVVGPNLSRHQVTAVKNSDWIIGEEDVVESVTPLICSQEALPIISSTAAVSPDSVEEQVTQDVKLRGNLEWAPPRRQIIFVVNVPARNSTAKKAAIMKQNNRCAGCGMKIEASYLPRMLFCYYTGKYFCQFGCQEVSRKSVIPALVLSKWNFDKFPVSNFAMQFIASIQNDKLFDLESLGFLSSLRKKSKTLSRILDLRSQLVTLRNYITTCKRGGNILLYYLIFDSGPKDFVVFHPKDLYCFSLCDLALIKSSSSKKVIEDMIKIVNLSVHHVSNCASCRARGFYCEICSSSPNKKKSSSSRDIIFPFELGRVVTCPSCGSCFHMKCVASNPGHKCLKCERRKRRLSEVPSQISDEDEKQDLESTLKNSQVVNNSAQKCNQSPCLKDISVISNAGGTVLGN